MKQTAGSFRGSCRLVVATVVVGFAGVVALSTNQQEADAAGLALPPLTTPQITVPSVTTPLGPTPQVVVPPVSTPQVTVPAPTRQAPLPTPSVSVPPLPTPSISTPAPPVSVPQVKTPAGPAPSATVRPGSDSPAAVDVPSASAPGTTSRTPSAELRAPSTRTPDASSGGSSGSPAGAQTSPVGGAGGGGGSLPSLPQGGDATVAALALSHAAAVRDLSPAARRKLLRRAWDEPLRGRHLRALRSTLREHGECFGTLPPQGRRALSLRAGLGDRRPQSRRAIARRLDVPLERELSIEASSLRQLAACGGGGAAAAGASGWWPGAAAGAPPASGGQRQIAATFDDRGSQAGDRGGVLGAAQDGPAAVPVIDVPDDTESANALLLLALALLGPLAIALLAGRGRRGKQLGPPRA